MRMLTLILLLATTSTALIAGLFYAYSCSVNPGLGKLADRAYLEAMKSINQSILNPLFFISFLGAVLLLPASSVLAYGHHRECFLLLFAASFVYLVGSFGVTIFGNVPLNNTLERMDPGSLSSEDIARARARFEIPWNSLHAIRTLFSVAALVLCIIACIRYAAKSVV